MDKKPHETSRSITRQLFVHRIIVSIEREEAEHIPHIYHLTFNLGFNFQFFNC